MTSFFIMPNVVVTTNYSPKLLIVHLLISSKLCLIILEKLSLLKCMLTLQTRYTLVLKYVSLTLLQISLTSILGQTNNLFQILLSRDTNRTNMLENQTHQSHWISLVLFFCAFCFFFFLLNKRKNNSLIVKPGVHHIITYEPSLL